MGYIQIHKETYYDRNATLNQRIRGYSWDCSLIMCFYSRRSYETELIASEAEEQVDGIRCIFHVR